MSSHPVHGLPFLPGNSYRDPTKSAFHVSQTLTYRNGFNYPLLPIVGVGREPHTVNQLSQAELDELANKRPTLTYGQAKNAYPSTFVPAHVAFDKKVLTFDAYFQEIVPISQQEHYRVRKVFIYYYLEDDSIAVIEPPIENSGMPQGAFIKRQRLPKNDNGDTYHWKDLNVGININLYGRTFRITSCDKFTKEFFESEGIELNPTEGIPSDPYTEFRKQPEHTFTTSTNFDKLKQFLTMDRRVLQFFSVWTDSDCIHSETWPVIIHYFLVDDTVEIREVHERNDGRDPFPVLMSRQRLPKTIKNVKDTFPICVLELSDQEVTEWYSPRDFIVGSYVTIMGRKFFLHDCDAYTKEFYAKNLGILGLTPVKMVKKVEEEVKPEIPPYNGFGLLEDTVQNCISLIPKRPKKDVMKLLKNQHKVLRYEVVLDTMYPEEKGRRFIMSYFLSDDMICIFEPKIRNSGFMEGQYLEKRKVPKPNSTSENPIYYGPEDFKIGSMVEVFGHRFIITNADEHVLNYIRAHKEKYPSDVLTSLENHFQHYAQQGSRTPSSSDLHKTPK